MDVSEMSMAELNEGINSMNAALAEYAARPRASLRSPLRGRPYANA